MFRNFRKDSSLKKSWKWFFEDWFFLYMAAYIAYAITKQASKHGHVREQTVERLFLLTLVLFGVWILCTILYWMKPQWFRQKLHSEQNVQVSDTTGVE